MSNDATRYTVSSKILQQMLSGTFYYVSTNITLKERNGCDRDVQHKKTHKTSVVRYENKAIYLNWVKLALSRS